MSRNIGLKDLYVALVTKNDITEYTTATPVKLCNAVSAKVTEKIDAEDYYEDDSKAGSVSGAPQITVEFEGNKLSLSARALIFGKTLVNGMLVSGDNDVIPEVAFGYRAKNDDGKYDFRWCYCGKFNQGITDSFETNADKPKIQTSGTIQGSFYSRQKDKNSQVQINENELVTGNTAAAALLAVDSTTKIIKWFTAVPEPLTA